MTNVLRKTMMASAGALLFAVAQLTMAGPITLTPADADYVYGDGTSTTPALDADDVATIFGTSSTLELLYKSEFEGGEEGSYSGSYMTEYSGDPNNAIISFLGGNAIQCPECYLVVKDGRQPQYLFDIGHWDGTSTISLLNFYPNQGAISHVAIFGKFSDVPVPEPGTALLLATGIFGLVASRKRMKKSA